MPTVNESMLVDNKWPYHSRSKPQQK